MSRTQTSGPARQRRATLQANECLLDEPWFVVICVSGELLAAGGSLRDGNGSLQAIGGAKSLWQLPGWPNGRAARSRVREALEAAASGAPCSLTLARKGFAALELELRPFTVAGAPSLVLVEGGASHGRAAPDDLCAALESADIGIAIIGEDETLLNPSCAWNSLLGWNGSPTDGRPLSSWWADNGGERLRMALQELRSDGHPRELELQPAAAESRSLMLSLAPLRGTAEQGGYGAVIALARDITARKRAEMAARESEARFRALVASLQQGVVVQDASGAVTDWNAAAERILGAEGVELAHHSLTDPAWWAIRENGSPLPAAEHPAMRALASGKGQSGVLGVRRQDGGLAWIAVQSVPLVRDGEGLPYAVVSSFSDVTLLREKEKELEHSAYHDALTGLPNRRYFFEAAGRAFHDAERKGSVRDAVLLLDLDGFKRVNDMFGHELGDELLTHAAMRLGRCIRPGDVAARLDGDEFALLLLDVGSVWNAVRIAQRILEAFAEPFRLGGVALEVPTSIGIAVAPETVCDPDSTINQAGIALRRAKAGGSSRYVVYDAHLDARARDNLEIEVDLRQALARNEFEVHYQPIIDLGNDTASGAETLLRWRHPKRGMVSPAEFIPVAEDNGTIHPIGEWVLEQSLTQLKGWLERYPGLHLGINLSPRQLESPQFLTTFARILGVSGVPHDAVMLELTETYLMQDVERAARDLRRFASLGVHIAIDDFGTGYSSLKYLQHLPITHLKIDRSFIHKIIREDRSRVLVEAVLLLADKLELKVVAEGVETEEQAELLKGIGCRWAQGYLYERPMPAASFDSYLGRMGPKSG